MSMKSMLKTTQEKAEQALAKAQAADAKRLQIAEWFDSVAGEGAPLPKFVHLTDLYGTVAVLAYEDASPATVEQLLKLFPPVEFGVYRGTFGSVMAKQFFDSSEKAQKDYSDRRDGGRMYIDLRRSSPQYPTQASVKWWAQYGEDLIKFDVELAAAFGKYLPELQARVVTHQGVLVRLENHSVGLVPGAPLLQTLMRYGSGLQSYPNVLLGGPVEEYLAWIKSTVEAERVARREAYMKDALEGIEPVKSAGLYENQGLKAGTKAQFECLNTHEARIDQALARKHWLAYCEANGLKPRNSYFDHYEWVVHWLTLHDLLVDRTVINGVETDYKYGTAWL